MSDTELYQNLLGIVSPWTVNSVTMDVGKQRVDMTGLHPPRILFSILLDNMKDGLSNLHSVD